MAVWCRRGVERGAVSRAFTVDHLLDALKGSDTNQVYIELDGGGWISEAGGSGAAKACVRARLAPHALCAGALLTRSSAGLRMRATAALPPHAELLLWFADDVLAALDMPVLMLCNIRGRSDYVCHQCGCTFDDPNPLKVHIFLACAVYDTTLFWREAASRLRVHIEDRSAIVPKNSPAPKPGHAPNLRLTAELSLAPAQLEALATEWGRARGGHVCVYCGKLYSRRYGLKIHLRTHTGYRPLRCRHCLRAFGDPSNLNKHERLHAGGAGGARRATGARYSCAACGRALARRRDLERHLRTHAQTDNETPV